MTISPERVRDEAKVVAEVRIDDAWELVEEFSNLKRDSGSADEAEAIERVVGRLRRWNVSHEVYEPEALVSLPLAASLRIGDRIYQAKTPSMAGSTSETGETAPLVYQKATFPATMDDIFARGSVAGEVEGKFVLSEGLPMPSNVLELESRGARGLVLISPGDLIHEGIATTIWGTPDLTSVSRQPSLPVVSITRTDGNALIEQLRDDSTEATIVARHDTGWRRIPVIVAEIRGQVEPDRFVLLHAHLDSWHVGVGDNATGDATILEVARALSQSRSLTRSVRICWWSGHSHARYAGSTWYVDRHANDLARNCICHINCDSPGCHDATTLEVYSTAELETCATQAIADFTGLASAGTHPAIRAGDNSFSNLGLSMICFLSTMPASVIAERGLYTSGGCGGNIEWHTEADTIEIADREILLRDMRLYAGTVFRTANAAAHPLHFTATIDQLEMQLARYERELNGIVDFARLRPMMEMTRRSLEALYENTESNNDLRQLRTTNDSLLAIGRALVPILYVRESKYRQDPALGVALLPDLAAVAEARGTVDEHVVSTEAIRAANRIEGALLDVLDACRMD